MEAGEGGAAEEVAYAGPEVVWVDEVDPDPVRAPWVSQHSSTGDSKSTGSSTTGSGRRKGTAVDTKLARRRVAQAMQNDSTSGLLLAAQLGWLTDGSGMVHAVEECLRVDRPRCLRALAWLCTDTAAIKSAVRSALNDALEAGRTGVVQTFVGGICGYPALAACAPSATGATAAADGHPVRRDYRQLVDLPGDPAPADWCAAMGSLADFEEAVASGVVRQYPSTIDRRFVKCEYWLLYSRSLRYAAARGCRPVVRRLLQLGHMRFLRSTFSDTTYQLCKKARDRNMAARILSTVAPSAQTEHVDAFEAASALCGADGAINKLLGDPFHLFTHDGLLLACRLGNVPTVTLLRKRPFGFDVSYWPAAVISGKRDVVCAMADRCPEGLRDAVLAARTGQPYGHLLLSARIRPTERVSPLHVACALGRVGCVAALLDAGADINGTLLDESELLGELEWVHDDEYYAPRPARLSNRLVTPLRVATNGGNIQCVQLLLRRGASLTPLVEDDGASWATSDDDVASSEPEEDEAAPAALPAEQVDVVAALLVRHARDNHAGWMKAAASKRINPHKNASMWRPLHWAVEDDDAGAVAALAPLLARDGTRDLQHRTPLHLAAELGRAGTVATLVAAGADVGAVMADGSTPLNVAAASGHVEVAAALLAGGSSVNALDKSGRAPLHAACRAGRVAAAAALVGAGADVAATSRWGWTALHHAAAGGSGAMVRWLLDAGARVAAADAFGSEPLHVAAEWGAVEAIGVLCAGGAGVNRRNGVGASPLRLAVMHGHAAAVTALVAAGALVDAVSKAGYTPLADALRCGHVDVTAALLSAGARVTAPGVGGGGDGAGAAAVVAVSLAGRPDGVVRRLARGLLSVSERAVMHEAPSFAVHAACAGDCLPVLEALAAAGADTKAASAEAWENLRPLHVAARWGAADCMRWLLAHEGDAQVDASLLFADALASGTGACVALTMNTIPACVPADLHALWPKLSADEQLAVAHRMAQSQDKGYTSAQLLMLAACNADDGVAVAALTKDAALMSCGDSVSWSPLRMAITAGAARAVEALVRAGADVRSYTTEFGYRDEPLQLALDNQHADIAATLIRAGAVLSKWPAAPYSTMSPDVARRLASAVIAHPYMSLLEATVCRKRTDALRWLAQQGSALRWKEASRVVNDAVLRGRAQQLEILLAGGVSRETARSALLSACSYGRVDFVRLLLGCGAPCDPAHRCELLVSTLGYGKRSEQMVSLLLDAFGDETALHEHAETLLCECFEQRNARMALRLVRAGVNVGVPLGGMSKVLRRQLVKAVRSSVRVKGESAVRVLLRAACCAGCVELLSWLVGRGVPRTVLHDLLTLNEAYDVACLGRLLAADLAVPAAVLSRALEAACQHSSPEAVRLLLARGASWSSAEQAARVAHAMATSSPRPPLGVWLELLDARSLPPSVWQAVHSDWLRLGDARTDHMSVLLARGAPLQMRLPSGGWGEPVYASADAPWAVTVLQACKSIDATAVVGQIATEGGLASFLRLGGWGLWSHLAECLRGAVSVSAAPASLLLLQTGADPLTGERDGTGAHALMCTADAQAGRQLGCFCSPDGPLPERDGVLLAMAGVMRWRRRRWPVVAWTLWGDEVQTDAAPWRVARAGTTATADRVVGEEKVGRKRERPGDDGVGDMGGEGSAPPAKRAPSRMSGDSE
jgi:ankyrin repeat protein